MTTPSQLTEQSALLGGKQPYHYYLDGKRIDNPSSSLTGAEIRAKLPADQQNYAIYQEVEGDEPDRLITDSETFSLEHHTPHFFSVPPANFGSE